MVAGRCDLIIEQGEDWACQFQFLDDYDNAKQLVNPARMDIVDQVGSVLYSLMTEDDPAPDQIPSLVISGEIGLIQAYIPSAVTDTFPPGQYKYDLFTSQDDGDVYAGNQVGRQLFGTVTVNKRITETF